MCFRDYDPIGDLPDEIGIAFDTHGIQITTQSADLSVLKIFPWSKIGRFTGWQPSADPDDMELFKFQVTGFGLYQVQCDSSQVFMANFQRGKANSKDAQTVQCLGFKCRPCLNGFVFFDEVSECIYDQGNDNMTVTLEQYLEQDKTGLAEQVPDHLQRIAM